MSTKKEEFHTLSSFPAQNTDKVHSAIKGKIHFIAIGGSAMHNLALALHLKGYQVSGSDDEIFEPAKGRLAKYGLLPQTEGWYPDKIHFDLEAVILGMHAREDNPELLRAQELGLKIYSYPEFLYNQSKDKIRIVIGGSHGKTSITAMILHVLQSLQIACDYMVGAQLEGFEVMVKLSEDAPYMLLEGDEYLTSPIDRRPKFHLYNPHIGVINGIAWDHINVFPTFPIYVEQFKIFADSIMPKGSLFYYEGDPEAKIIGENTRPDINSQPYTHIPYIVEEGTSYVEHLGVKYPLLIFGKHNMQNLAAAWMVCQSIGIEKKAFLESIVNFKGASRRLEFIAANEQAAMYKDFAHSPSKLEATVKAMKEQYPKRHLVAAMELHTFSSLREDFLKHYVGCMNVADTAIVYFNPHALAHKKLPPISKEMVLEAFGRPDLLVFDDSKELVEYLKNLKWEQQNLLWMSSGNFDGVNEKELAAQLF